MRTTRLTIEAIRLIDQDGWADLYRPFLKVAEAESYRQKLWHETAWETRHLRMMGRVIAMPRLVAFAGSCDYRYSAQTHKAEPPQATLNELISRIENHLRTDFNGVLLNAYRDGNDSMSWHADNEKELGTDPLIASLSLGATRKFRLRHNQTRVSQDIWLESGDLLVMGGRLQHCWQHMLPKTKKPCGLRINLTCRYHKS